MSSEKGSSIKVVTNDSKGTCSSGYILSTFLKLPAPPRAVLLVGIMFGSFMCRVEIIEDTRGKSSKGKGQTKEWIVSLTCVNVTHPFFRCERQKRKLATADSEAEIWRFKWYTTRTGKWRRCKEERHFWVRDGGFVTSDLRREAAWSAHGFVPCFAPFFSKQWLMGPQSILTRNWGALGPPCVGRFAIEVDGPPLCSFHCVGSQQFI